MRRAAAESVAFGVIWSNLPLPAKVIAMGLTAKLMGFDDLTQTWLQR